MATKAKKLIKLAENFAKEKGFDLSETEKKLLTSVAEGEKADYSSTDEAENNPEKGDTWDKSRSPNINVIIWLCTDKEAISYLTHRGIRITGAKIDGCLDLNYIDLDIPLVFRSCYFTEGIKLRCAKVKLLDFSGSHIVSSGRSIDATNAEIKGYVYLGDGFNAKGGIHFESAIIGGRFHCNGGVFENPGKYAIFAQNVEIKDNVFLTNGFRSKGTVWFYGASIGGSLDCQGGIFENAEDFAINAEDAEIKLSVFFGQDNDKKDGVTEEVTTEVTGKISFFNAHINGIFDLSGIKNPKNMKLNLSFAKIGILKDNPDSWPKHKNLWLEGLVYETIENEVLAKSESGESKKSFLEWIVDLIFKYLLHRKLHKNSKKSRVHWIRLQNLDKNFSPQPYEQLANVLRLSGYEKKAVDVLIAKQNDRAKYANCSRLRRLWLSILNRTIRHGYRPHRALYFALFFIISGGYFFSWGNSQNLMTPSNNIEPFNHINDEEISEKYPKITNILTNYPQFEELSTYYPKLNAFMYSVDAFVPIINFHQQDYWLPNANKGGNTIIPIVSLEFPNNNLLPKLNISQAKTGSLLRWYLWVHIFMGWVLTSLWVAGFTGLVRRLE